MTVLALLGLALAGPIHPVPLAGLEWRPLSRADLTWVAEDRTSGTGVAEFDGNVSPLLSAFGGLWLVDRVGLVGGLGVARLTSTTWSGESWRQRHWGVVRPSLDVRFAPWKRTTGRPSPWLLLGGHGDIPSARDTSNAFSDEEEAVAEEDAKVERARLGGLGGRVGVGVDLRFAPGLVVGAQYAVLWHRGVLRTSEQDSVTSWVAGEAALVLGFEWADGPAKKPD
jgi:hypothetical protein